MAYITPDNPNVRPPEQPPYQRQPGDESTTAATSSGEELATVRVATAGTSIEVLAGAAAIVLAIIGLAGYLTIYMAAIATIAIGVGELAEGGALAARWKDITRRLGPSRTEVEGGMGAEMFAGLAGIVLGILALAHVVPLALLPIAAIVLGASVVFGGAAEPELGELVHERDRSREHVMRETVRGTSGAMVIAGLGAAVLGILALINVGPVITLSIVAMLAIGAALLLGGGALTARFASKLTA